MSIRSETPADGDPPLVHRDDPLILHHDDALIVLCKPSGLLAVPGRGALLQDCAALRVQRAFPEARVVHRLDMSTSGLMVMAIGGAAQRSLSMAFERREVDKRYVAVVAGALEAPTRGDGWGDVELPLAADWPHRPRQRVDAEHGKPSHTRYRVVTRDSANATAHTTSHATTRVELQPLTGRTHQLRVHLMAIGHPIAGDALYAPPEVIALAPRLLLHASALAFTHPTRGERMMFTSTPDF